jgi:prephenate dehydrogenase
VAALDKRPIAVIGLGVIGGSLVKALARRGATVRAFSASDLDVDAARRASVDVASDLRSCVAEARIALIAVPLATQAAVAAEVVGAAHADAILLHAGSLQSATAIHSAADRDVVAVRAEIVSRVVGTHPFAGSHRSGFAAADAELFTGCVVFVEERADAATRAAAEELWRAAGAARVEYMSADEHDRLMTWVSHLPQLASTALAHAIGEAGIPSTMLGPGGRDATRLAASPFTMWRGILAAAPMEAARAAAALERSAGALRAALEGSDMAAIERMWTAARSWRESADSAGGTADQTGRP